MKAQLQKIATSRTGGQKTDQALGKTSTGPEGLPHSIIVTADGIEGEAELATQVEADQTAAVPTAESELRGPTRSADEPGPKGTSTKGTGAKTPPKRTTTKSEQIAFVVGKPGAKKKSDGKSLKSMKAPGPRKPK
ncbi:MAG: hypothetical protein HZC50_11975 [Nitrospirae bacterium]|nr:hypothetical protein [Nitrospirota bacterium]